MGQDGEGVGSPVSTEEMIHGKDPEYGALVLRHIHILLISELACPLLPQTPGTPPQPLEALRPIHLCSLSAPAPFPLGLTAQLRALWPHTNKTRSPSALASPLHANPVYTMVPTLISPPNSCSPTPTPAPNPQLPPQSIRSSSTGSHALGLGPGPGICISNKRPGDVDAAGLDLVCRGRAPDGR